MVRVEDTATGVTEARIGGLGYNARQLYTAVPLEVHNAIETRDRRGRRNDSTCRHLAPPAGNAANPAYGRLCAPDAGSSERSPRRFRGTRPGPHDENL